MFDLFRCGSLDLLVDVHAGRDVVDGRQRRLVTLVIAAMRETCGRVRGRVDLLELADRDVRVDLGRLE
jgi:hypothetical protein